MTIILLFILAQVFIQPSFSSDGGFKDYMSKESISSIKGFFVLLVVFRHFGQYYSYDGAFDSFAKFFNGNLSQLLVVMFLFYSGYGIMFKLRQNKKYLDSLPSKTFTLFIHYAIAVILYFLLQVILNHRKYTVSKFLLSLIGWESFGNSNWYFFAIAIAYLIAYLSFKVFKNDKLSCVVLTALCIIYVLVMMRYKEKHWFNTFLAFPLGFWYSIFKEKIDNYILKKDFLYYVSLTVLFLLFFFGFTRRNTNVWYYSLWACSFGLLIVLMSYRIRIDNRILCFFGDHLFGIYILQRIPMIILDKYGQIDKHLFLSFCVVLTTTICMTLAFEYLTGRLDMKLLKIRDKEMGSRTLEAK